MVATSRRGRRQGSLGEILSEKDEFEEAVKWLTPAAEGGDATAGCTLGRV
jgi:hypothetical protein